MYLVISTSLNPDSRSRILARSAVAILEKYSDSVTFLDIVQLKLPLCDGGACYGDPQISKIADAIQTAKGVLVAVPIYNYDVSSSAKNLIELTGKAWTDKVVGFLCAAGGQGSFMAPMGFANSLMLDFRSLILPRFVFATDESFSADQIADFDCERRVEELVGELVRVSTALHAETHGDS